ncbi:putative uracil phosphoribosyltransferase [Anopheles sinensis]|uniref:Putative uracil phosphoribosyltransferase n=1 Tax=Anopheles sinensis TaxID=74873 RepID=A0A084WK98_ANOSI|nr:putative uracil phosphoribosyltransferase [Anopheles sinensis]
MDGFWSPFIAVCASAFVLSPSIAILAHPIAASQLEKLSAPAEMEPHHRVLARLCRNRKWRRIENSWPLLAKTETELPAICN